MLISSKKENKNHNNIEKQKPNFWTEEEDKILKEKAKEFNYIKIGILFRNLYQEEHQFNALQDSGVLSLD